MDMGGEDSVRGVASGGFGPSRRAVGWGANLPRRVSSIVPATARGVAHTGPAERSVRTVAVCPGAGDSFVRSEEHTSELQSRGHLVCRLLLEKKKEKIQNIASAMILMVLQY